MGIYIVFAIVWYLIVGKNVVIKPGKDVNLMNVEVADSTFGFIGEIAGS